MGQCATRPHHTYAGDYIKRDHWVFADLAVK